MLGNGDGQWLMRRVDRHQRDDAHDLALLRIEGPAAPALALGDSERVREGDDLAFTGFPIGGVLGYSPVTHRATVSSITPAALPSPSARQLQERAVRGLRNGTFEIFQLDATAYPGNSGGPLFHPQTGEVLGVLNMVLVKSRRESVLSNPSGIAYAIPAADLARIVTGLVEETLLPLPELGLTARPVDRQLAAALNIPATGLLVDSVADGSLAGSVRNTANFILDGRLFGELNNVGTMQIAGQVDGFTLNNGTITNIGNSVFFGRFEQSASMGTSLNLAGFNTSLGSLNGAGTVNLSTAVLTVGSDNTDARFSGVIDGQGLQINQQPQQHAPQHHEAELEGFPQQVQLARHLGVTRLMGRRAAFVEPPERQQVAEGNRGQHDTGHLEDHRQVAAEVLHIGEPQPHQEQDEIDHLAQRLIDQLDEPGGREGDQIADA